YTLRQSSVIRILQFSAAVWPIFKRQAGQWNAGQKRHPVGIEIKSFNFDFYRHLVSSSSLVLVISRPIEGFIGAGLSSSELNSTRNAVTMMAARHRPPLIESLSDVSSVNHKYL